MGRSFNGTSDILRLAPGNVTDGPFATGTIGLIFKKNSDRTTFSVPLCFGASDDSASFYPYVDNGSAGRIGFWTGSTDATQLSAFVSSTDGWVLLLFTHTTGSNQLRAHKYVYDTDTWVHQSMGTVGNTVTPTSADLGGGVLMAATIGAQRSGGTPQNFSPVSVEIAGWASTTFADDAAVEASGLESSYSAWQSKFDVALWPLNQASTATAVTDESGNGADEVSHDGSTVVTGPAGFSYGSGDATVDASGAPADATGSAPAPTVTGATGATVTPPAAAGTGDAVEPALVPLNTALPVLSTDGDPDVAFPGDTLTLTDGTWTNGPTGFTYIFRQSDVPTTIQSGASNTYTLQASDVGHSISGRVIATNGTGDSAAAVANDLVPSGASDSRVSPSPIAPPAATGAGKAPAPANQVDLEVDPGPSSATGQAVAPGVGVGQTIAPPIAGATGDAADPSLAAGVDVTSPAATGAGDAPNPSISSSDGTTISTPASSGTGDAPDPAVSAGASVTAPVADGAGVAKPPTSVGTPVAPQEFVAVGVQPTVPVFAVASTSIPAQAVAEPSVPVVVIASPELVAA